VGRRASNQNWRRIVQLLAEGCTNQEIADRVNLSVRSVKWYTAELMREAGLTGSGDERRLIVWAVKQAARE
jgi:DNA-binding NarL/FixJ family response regulator